MVGGLRWLCDSRVRSTGTLWRALGRDVLPVSIPPRPFGVAKVVVLSLFVLPGPCSGAQAEVFARKENPPIPPIQRNPVALGGWLLNRVSLPKVPPTPSLGSPELAPPPPPAGADCRLHYGALCNLMWWLGEMQA